MLCPKCGEEYEGKNCPRCEGPEIIVNNDEYLRRRKAYEEKQAGIKSASSDIESSEQADTDETAEVKAAKAVIEEMKKAKVKAKTVVTSNQSRVKKITKVAVLAVAALIVLVISVLAVAAVINANKGIVYYVRDGKLYQVKGNSAKQICETENIAFCHDYRHFFEMDIPSEVSGKAVSHCVASDKGKYFAAAAYDEDRRLYCLYVWNNKECVTVAESSGQQTIINVENDGRVIYKETVVVNDEGGTGDTALYVYSLKDKSLKKIEGSAKGIYLYEAYSTLIYLDRDNVLYTYDYAKGTESKIVAESADSIYVADTDTKDFYTNMAAVVNASSDAKGFIYNTGGECYYHKIISTGEDVYLGRASGAGVEFVYKENKFVYMAASSVLRYADIKNGTVGEYRQIAELGANSDIIYISGDETLVCVDDSSSLIKVKSGKTQNMAEGVEDGSLSRVVNSDKAFSYTKDGEKYYAGNLRGKPVQLVEASGRGDSYEVVFCKNKLYYSNGSGELIRCGSNGKKTENLGAVEQFWVAG